MHAHAEAGGTRFRRVRNFSPVRSKPLPRAVPTLLVASRGPGNHREQKVTILLPKIPALQGRLGRRWTKLSRAESLNTKGIL